MMQIQPTIPKIVERGHNLPATGPIWIILNGNPFPSQDWDDFVVVIMSAMCTAITRLLSGLSEQETIYFMDGPHQLLFTKKKNTSSCRLTVRSMERDIDSSNCDLMAIAAQLLDRVDKIVKIAKPTRDARMLKDQGYMLADTVHQINIHK